MTEAQGDQLIELATACRFLGVAIVVGLAFIGACHFMRLLHYWWSSHGMFGSKD